MRMSKTEDMTPTGRPTETEKSPELKYVVTQMFTDGLLNQSDHQGL